MFLNFILFYLKDRKERICPQQWGGGVEARTQDPETQGPRDPGTQGPYHVSHKGSYNSDTDSHSLPASASLTFAGNWEENQWVGAFSVSQIKQGKFFKNQLVDFA